MSPDATAQVLAQLARLQGRPLLDEDQQRDLFDAQMALEALGYMFESAAMLVPLPNSGLHAPLELPAHNMAALMRVMGRAVERVSSAPALGSALDLGGGCGGPRP